MPLPAIETQHEVPTFTNIFYHCVQIHGGKKSIKSFCATFEIKNYA